MNGKSEDFSNRAPETSATELAPRFLRIVLTLAKTPNRCIRTIAIPRVASRVWAEAQTYTPRNDRKRNKSRAPRLRHGLLSNVRCADKLQIPRGCAARGDNKKQKIRKIRAIRGLVLICVHQCLSAAKLKRTGAKTARRLRRTAECRPHHTSWRRGDRRPCRRRSR